MVAVIVMMLFGLVWSSAPCDHEHALEQWCGVDLLGNYADPSCPMFSPPPPGNCTSGYVCSRDDVCVAGENGPCKVDSDCVQTLVKYLCLNNTCKEKGTLGTPCGYYADCKGALQCNNKFCGHRTYLPVGAACTSDLQCQYLCGENGVGTCNPPGGSAGCTDDWECAGKGGRCCKGMCKSINSCNYNTPSGQRPD